MSEDPTTSYDLLRQQHLALSQLQQADQQLKQLLLQQRNDGPQAQLIRRAAVAEERMAQAVQGLGHSTQLHRNGLERLQRGDFAETSAQQQYLTNMHADQQQRMAALGEAFAECRAVHRMLAEAGQRDPGLRTLQERMAAVGYAGQKVNENAQRYSQALEQQRQALSAPDVALDDPFAPAPPQQDPFAPTAPSAGNDLDAARAALPLPQIAAEAPQPVREGVVHEPDGRIFYHRFGASIQLDENMMPMIERAPVAGGASSLGRSLERGLDVPSARRRQPGADELEREQRLPSPGGEGFGGYPAF